MDHWRSKEGGNVTWGLDGDGMVARKYGVAFLGQTVVIDRNGTVVYNGGPLNYDSLVKLVDGS